MPADVVMYTTPVCPYCVRAKRLFATRGVAFSEVDVDHRPDLRSWLVSASGQRTVPQIFINGRSIGGFDELAILDRKGALAALVAEPPGTEEPLPR